MKPFILATLATMVAIPAQAGLVLLPNLFAREYCNMRQLGVSHNEAIEVAVNESAIEGTPIEVTIDGKKYDADVIKANQTARARCPQYF